MKQTSMKSERKKNVNPVADKRQLFTALFQIVCGWTGVIFFGLALLGFGVSPDRQPGYLPSALFTALLFAVCILLIRRGRKNLRGYRSGGSWAGEVVTGKQQAAAVTAGAVDTVQAQNYEAPPRVVGSTAVKIKCESCGAVGAPDEDGRCEYCGTWLG